MNVLQDISKNVYKYNNLELLNKAVIAFCNQQQLVGLVNGICDKEEKFRNYGEIIISGIRNNNIDGGVLLEHDAIELVKLIMSESSEESKFGRAIYNIYQQLPLNDELLTIFFCCKRKIAAWESESTTAIITFVL